MGYRHFRVFIVKFTVVNFTFTLCQRGTDQFDFSRAAVGSVPVLVREYKIVESETIIKIRSY